MDILNLKFQSLSKSYMQAAIAGRRDEAREILESGYRESNSIFDVYRKIILPALEDIGTEWEEGKVSISEEHLATNITLEQMTILREKISVKPKLNKKALVTTLPNDQHILGARMVADYFYADGWDVEFLGANTPVNEIISFLSKKKIDVLLISISSKETLKDFKKLCKEFSLTSDPPMLIVGGRIVKDYSIKRYLSEADLVITDPELAIIEARKYCGITGSNISLEQQLTQLGKRIQELRFKKGINQQKLSELSSLDRTYISAIENGKKNITFSALLRIAEALDVKVTQLLE